MLQVALSGDGAYLVVHAPLSYSRQYNIPGNDNSGNVYTYKLVSSHCTQQVLCVQHILFALEGQDWAIADNCNAWLHSGPELILLCRASNKIQL